MNKLTDRLISQEETVTQKTSAFPKMGNGDRPISPVYFTPKSIPKNITLSLQEAENNSLAPEADSAPLPVESVMRIKTISVQPSSSVISTNQSAPTSFKVAFGLSFLLVGTVFFFATYQVIKLANTVSMPSSSVSAASSFSQNTQNGTASLALYGGAASKAEVLKSSVNGGRKHALTDEEEKLPFTLLGVTAESSKSSPDTEKLVYSAGRMDPFLPLAQSEAPVINPEKERDILDSVHFTGFIDDTNPKLRVALLKVVDLAGAEKTYVKKINETFYVEGHTIQVRQANKDVLSLSVDGIPRRLSLDPFVDTSQLASSGNTGNSTPVNASPAVNSGASGNSSGGTRSETEKAALKAKSERILDGLVE